MKIGQPAERSNVSAPQSPASGAAAPVKKDTETKQAAATASGSAHSAGVAVTVSNAVRTLERVNLGESAEIDSEKIKAVRDAIDNGTYVVNPEAIADRLLANAQEMLSRTKS